MRNVDTTRQMLDRLAALHDHLDDIEALLPESPWSFSHAQLQVALMCQTTRRQLTPLLAQVQEAARR